MAKNKMGVQKWKVLRKFLHVAKFRRLRNFLVFFFKYQFFFMRQISFFFIIIFLIIKNLYIYIYIYIYIIKDKKQNSVVCDKNQKQSNTVQGIVEAAKFRNLHNLARTVQAANFCILRKFAGCESLQPVKFRIRNMRNFARLQNFLGEFLNLQEFDLQK